MPLNVTPLQLSFLLSPIDPQASYRAPWCLNETMAGLFRGGGDGGQNDAAAEGASLQFQNQPALEQINGPLSFARFLPEGTLQTGALSALSSRPDKELCGITATLRVLPLQNRAEGEDETYAPDSPKGAPVLLWRSEQGSGLETIIPARAPVVSMVRHRAAPANRTVKIKTVASWPETQGFQAAFDFGGIPQTHRGDAATRLAWGDKFSLVFRGIGANAFPQLERRRDAKWELVRTLNQGAAIDAAFWTRSHLFKVFRLGDRMVFELDGVAYWIQEVARDGETVTPTLVTWPRAPLRLNVMGVDCAFQVSRVTGKNEFDEFIEAGFRHQVGAPDRPIGNVAASFKVRGPRVVQSGGVRSRLRGAALEGVSVAGQWLDERAYYDVTLTCSEIEAPLLCAVCVDFPAPATTALPAPIEVVKAVSGWEIDSGDPETLPDSAANFTLAHSILQRLVPGWKTAVLPYRPCLIRARYQGQTSWKTLFEGFLTPESASREAWNDFGIPLQARGPMLRLMAPAALIDERFGPLSLLMDDAREQLFGAECARYLIGRELGTAAVANFNGNGNTFRFLPDAPYPLLSERGAGFFTATQNLGTSNFKLPPPFGSDVKSWIDSIAGFDYANWFYDASERAWCYGTLQDFLSARGAVRWNVPETAPPSNVTETRDWPLLSSLALSGLLDNSENEIRVATPPAKGNEDYSPGLFVGRAGDTNEDSQNPLSVAQSWRRTYLVKEDFIKEGTVGQSYVNDLAATIWRGFKGRPPRRLDLTFETGFLGPRWGELLTLPAGFEGVQNGGLSEDFRILQVKHRGAMDGGGGNWFETTITTRGLSASGQ